MKLSKLRLSLGLLFGACLATGCSSGSGNGGPVNNLNLPSAVRSAYDSGRSVSPSLAKSDNDLGYALLQKLQATDATKSALLSPVSLELPLNILYNGAQGQTLTSMAKTLGVVGTTPDSLNLDNAALQADLVSTDPKLQIEIANSLWRRPSAFPLLDSFVQTNQTYYGSELGDLAGAPKVIDDWVTAKTHGLITKAAPNLDYASVVYVLVNSVYFKGAWTSPFDPKVTANSTFTLLDSTTKQTLFMSQELSFPSLKNAQVEVARLPYGGKRWEMVVLLPPAGSDLKAFLASLNHTLIESWITQTTPQLFKLSLPKFKVSTQINFKQPLTDLGMGVIFNPTSADFSGISSTASYISYLSQTDVIEVNEEGTTAAGVTTGGGSVTSAPPGFSVNRPFVYLIRDSKPGIVLFAGTMLDPSVSQ